MSWRFGIPDFIGMYTYFKDLQFTKNNVPPAAIRKENLYAMATSAAHQLSAELKMPKNLTKANNFLSKVAASERNKEIMAIKSFCQQTGQKFPALEKFFNSPQSIEENPDGFYTELTAALNKARRGTQSYLDELLRIKQNLHTAGRTLQDYKADDYRYRLDGDITSFLHRLMGNYNVIKEEETNTYSMKAQKLVMKILDEANIVNRISAGGDFAAIASALLIQVEKEVQEEMDQVLLHGAKKDIDIVIDNALDKIEKKYLSIAYKRAQAITPVERAISDISSLEFNRIVKNAKEILGISSKNITDAAELKKMRDRIRKRDARAKKNEDLTQIRETIKKNKDLNRDLMLTKFSISGSQNSKHGTIYELVESMITGGTNIAGKGATDIITLVMNWQFQTDNSVMNTLMSSIAAEVTNAVTQQQITSPDEIKNTKEIIAHMNNRIQELITEAEKQMKEMEQFDLDNIFIFHETLKLYSSAETGRSKISGFEGRRMNLLSYIDDLYTMSNADIPITQSNMAFLALNIIGGAVAEDMKEPLEQYLSMYAGIMMFDDMANMAEEAIQNINQFNDNRKGKIIQIHLYNLNGIYVPASMFLSYINDTMQQVSNFASDDLIAKATITTASTNTKYERWAAGEGYENARKEVHAEGGRLNPAVWSAVASESASQTKITITFLAAFKRFIQSL